VREEEALLVATGSTVGQRLKDSTAEQKGEKPLEENNPSTQLMGKSQPAGPYSSSIAELLLLVDIKRPTFFHQRPTDRQAG
jgi:hypothetical protein